MRPTATTSLFACAGALSAAMIATTSCAGKPDALEHVAVAGQDDGTFALAWSRSGNGSTSVRVAVVDIRTSRVVRGAAAVTEAEKVFAVGVASGDAANPRIVWEALRGEKNEYGADRSRVETSSFANVSAPPATLGVGGQSGRDILAVPVGDGTLIATGGVFSLIGRDGTPAPLPRDTATSFAAFARDGQDGAWLLQDTSSGGGFCIFGCSGREAGDRISHLDRDGRVAGSISFAAGITASALAWHDGAGIVGGTASTGGGVAWVVRGVDASGQVGDDLVVDSESPGIFSTMQAAWDGSGYVVAWRATSDLKTARIAATRDRIDRPARAVDALRDEAFDRTWHLACAADACALATKGTLDDGRFVQIRLYPLAVDGSAQSPIIVEDTR